jgi:hypothetical protein
VKVVASWVLALLVVIGAGVGVEAGLGVEPGQSRSALAMKLDQFAVNFAASRRVPVTSLSWVATDGARYGTGVSGDPSAGPGTPFYVLEMYGHFYIGAAPGEGGQQTATRGGRGAQLTVMQLVLAYDGAGFEVVGEGTFTDWQPLIKYGSPETDSLVGMTPSG